MRRGAGAVIAAAALGAAGLTAGAAPAAAAPCSSTDSGVTVVVTFPNGSTSVRCAGGDPDSGATALLGAGFAITQVQTQPGFVCRIDGAPASEACVRTPPTSAYWSYWSAQPGGSWTYHSTGAYSRNPAPGTVEGWSFGAGAPPAIAPPRIDAAPPPPPPPPPPPAPAPPPPAPAPTTTTPQTTQPQTTQPQTRAPQTTTRAPAPAATTSPATTATQPATRSSMATPSSTGTSTASSTATQSAPTTEAPTETSAPTETGRATETGTATAAQTAPATSAPSDDARNGASDGANDESVAAPATDDRSGSAAGTIAGLGIVGLLLGAAGWMGWRRRTAP